MLQHTSAVGSNNRVQNAMKARFLDQASCSQFPVTISIMRPHIKASLDAESQRLDELFLLLGELTHCLWYATDLPTMLQQFCQILVLNDQYTSVEVSLFNPSLTPPISRVGNALAATRRLCKI